MLLPYQILINLRAGTQVNPSTGTITFNGYAVTIGQTANQNVSPNVGNFTFTGYAPVVFVSNNQSVIPSQANLVFTGYAPSITQAINTNVVPDPAIVSFSGYAPQIAQTVNQFVNLVNGTITITGYAPSVQQINGSLNIVPDVGLLAITGYVPQVDQTGATQQATPGFYRSYVKKQETEEEKRLRREAQGIIARAKTSAPDANLFEDAQDVTEQIKLEIARLDLKAKYFEARLQQEKQIEAQLKAEQLQAQINEIDEVFVLMMLLAQID